jgi:membrane protein YqaA with SNARE-associated domain
MKTSQLTVCYRGGNAGGIAGYWLGFSFDAEFLKTFKEKIPYFRYPNCNREWSEEKKLWWVSLSYEKELAALFTNFEALTKQQSNFLENIEPLDKDNTQAVQYTNNNRQ